MQKGNLIGLGRTAEVYAWNNDKILKLYFDWVPIDWIKYEAGVSGGAYDAGAPAPQVFEVIQMDGRNGLIYQRVDGVSLLSIIGAEPWHRRDYARRMARLHFKIHSFSSNKLPFQKDRFEHIIMNSASVLGKRTEKIIAYLNGLPNGNNVCHGDFHPDNILVSAAGWTTVDWMNSYAGNPLSDVARTLLMFNSPFIPPGIPPIMVKLVKRMIISPYLKEYLKLAQVKLEDIQAWMLPVAAARLQDRVPGEEKWLLDMIDNGLRRI